MKIVQYRSFYIVQSVNKGVALVNPYTEKTRVVKSIFAAKWRIGRTLTLAKKAERLV